MATDKDAKGLMAEWVPVDPEPQLEADLVAQLNRGEGDTRKLAFKLGRLCARTGRQYAA
jgi:hypothetical protein